MRILGIRRAERFSPGSAERDEAIFAAVARVLTAGGHQVTLTDEDRWCREAERPTAKGSDAEANAAAVFHMARDPQTLARLARLARHKVIVPVPQYRSSTVSSPVSPANSRALPYSTSAWSRFTW